MTILIFINILTIIYIDIYDGYTQMSKPLCSIKKDVNYNEI